jgi:hypothetical protein
MASAASLKIFLLAWDNPPRNSKTNNTVLKVGDRSPHPPGPGVGAYGNRTGGSSSTLVAENAHTIRILVVCLYIDAVCARRTTRRNDVVQ